MIIKEHFENLLKFMTFLKDILFRNKPFLLSVIINIVNVVYIFSSDAEHLYD